MRQLLFLQPTNYSFKFKLGSLKQSWMIDIDNVHVNEKTTLKNWAEFF